jgi:hypothetical protein
MIKITKAVNVNLVFSPLFSDNFIFFIVVRLTQCRPLLSHTSHRQCHFLYPLGISNCSCPSTITVELNRLFAR